MKKSHYKWLAMLSGVALTVAIAASCSREELTKDLNLYVGTEFLVNPITLQILDARQANKLPADATITIEGRDKDKIYSLLGEKKLTLIDGVVALAVKKGDLPSENNPLEFSVAISAPNYLTKHLDYVLKKSDAMVADIAMINVTTPPEGLSIAQNQFNSIAYNGVPTKVEINSATHNDKKEFSKVTVMPSTKMLTKEGREVSGKIESMIVHSDAKSIQSVSEIPGWGSSVKVKQADGQIAENVIESAGFFELKMHVGDIKIEKFSAPIESESYIDANTYNPESARKIQAGDQLSVLSLSEGNEIWNDEGVAIVQNADNGKLKIAFKLNHLSHYAYGWKRHYCNAELRVSSAITNWTKDYKCSQPLREYFYKIIDADDASKVYEKGWSTFGNGCYLESSAFPENTKVKVAIYERKHASTPLFTSDVVTPCNSNVLYIPSNALPKDNSVVVKVNVSGLCKGSINTTFLPSVSILYRELNNSESQWEHLVTLSPGRNTSTGCARGLVEGKTYDFAVAMNMNGKNELLTFAKTLRQPQGLTIKEQTIKVSSEFWGYTAANGFQENFEIKKTPGTNLFELNYPNCPLPEKACQEIENNFSAFVKKKK